MIFILCFIPYRGKPIIYITNNYYHWKGGGTYEKFNNFLPDKKYDVIIIGSSRAYRGYDPRIFKKAGYNAWNLGTSAQTIDNTYFVAKHYISSVNCSLLIIDIYSGAFENISIESSSDLIHNLSSDKAALEIACNTNDIRALNMLAVRFMTRNKGPMYSDNDYVGFGFTERNDKLPEKMRIALLNKPDENMYRKKVFYRVEYLDLLMQFCQEKNIKTVLVYAPVSDFYSMEEHRDFLKEISWIISKYQVPFFDYSKSLKISTLEYFYDKSHMNYKGVKIFNDTLIKDLQRINYLSSERQTN